MKKLVGVETAPANFFASGLLALGAKLGPFVWQLPPMMKFNEGAYDAARYESFFRLLPRTVRSALRLAKRCDERILARAFLEPTLKRGEDPHLRHAIEISHDSFVQSAFIELLKKHDMGLVVADTVERPLLMDVTSNFAHLRLHRLEGTWLSRIGGGFGDEGVINTQVINIPVGTWSLTCTTVRSINWSLGEWRVTHCPVTKTRTARSWPSQSKKC